MQRSRISAALLAAVLTLPSCSRDHADTAARTGAGANDAADYVLLVPDSQNGRVHRIGLDGSYQGGFVAAAAPNGEPPPQIALRVLRGILYLPDEPASFWLTARHGMSEWAPDGRFRRMLPPKTDVLENPTAVIAWRDDVLVVSEDKKRILILDHDGSVKRQIQSHVLDGATDLELGPDGLAYVSSALRSSAQEGLVTVWNLSLEAAPEPLRYLVTPDYAGGMTFIRSLLFDDDGNLLLADFARHQLVRWNVDTNTKMQTLLIGTQRNDFAQLARGPDGLVYVAGAKGIYRFDSRASAADLEGLEPFFRVETIAERLEKPFSPEQVAFVPRAALGDPAP